MMHVRGQPEGLLVAEELQNITTQEIKSGRWSVQILDRSVLGPGQEHAGSSAPYFRKARAGVDIELPERSW